MARADGRTLGLLNRWPEHMHEDGWRFNQIGGEGVRIVPNCQNQPYVQYERQYIADALVEAVGKAAEYLGFWPAPTWVTDDLLTINSDMRWSRQTLTTKFGHVIEFGRRATSLIAADVALVFSDRNSDQVDDWVTLTVTGVDGIPADEIQVFFRQEDGAPEGGDEYWQIEPLKVRKSGDSATIEGPRWLFVHPVKVWEKEYGDDRVQKFMGDTGDEDHFVTYVDVYRVYTDASNCVELLCHADQVGIDHAVVSATPQLSNAFMGDFTAYVGSGQSEPLAAPHSVRVSYRAGIPLVNGQMDRQLAIACIRYANTLMPQQPNMCDRVTMGMWAEDTETDTDSLAARDAWTPPPFGITNGGLFAWSVISARRIVLKGRPTKREV